jgi:hypothetical protein
MDDPLDHEEDTMNDGTGGGRWRRRSRRAGVLAILAGIALAAAACGSGGSSSGPSAVSSQAGGSTNYQKDLAYAQCMRSHGVPNFPDPNSNGVFTNNGINLESGTAKAAAQTCRPLLPNGGQLSQSQQQQRLDELLQFAKCMRSHGVPNFPDPTDTNGHLALNLKGSGIMSTSPQFQSAQQACQSVMPVPAGGGTTGGGGA